MKILLLNDTTNWYHFGCTATSTALIEKMKALGHRVTTLSITETYKIKSAPNTKKGFINQEVLQQFENDNPKLIQLIKTHDAVIFNGEGTLHGLNPAPSSLLYVAYISKTKYAKHVEILNHSPYPQHDETIHKTSEETAVYKLVYDNIDYAAIREPVSLSTMKKLNINAAECFDCMPIYIMDHYEMGQVLKDPKLILISGSATWLQLNIPSSERGNIQDFTQGLSDFNRYLESLEKQDYNIKFLYGAKAAPAKDDREFLEYMSRNFGREIEVHEANSLDDWLNIIESSSILVSGRFHHTIAAASLGVPYIALNSNTPKISGLMQILDSSQEVVNYNDENLFKKLSLLTNQKLDQYSPEKQTNTQLTLLYQKAEKNFDSLKKSDLGIVLLTSSELLENSHLYKYFLKEIISPIFSNDTSSQIDQLLSHIPQENSYWITAHFVFSSLGYFTLSSNNPKYSFFTKFSLPLISTIGYSSKLLISDLYQNLAQERITNNINNHLESNSDSFLDNCFYEVALTTSLAMIFSLPATLSFTPFGLSYSAFSTISSFTSSAISCASSNKLVISPSDTSFSAKTIPYLIDSTVAFSVIKSLSFHPMHSLPEVAINIKKAAFIISSVVSADHITKSIIEISSDEPFKFLDSFFCFDDSIDSNNPEL